MDSILPILKKIPIFSELTENEHKEIIRSIIMNYYPAGHVFFREGDQGGSMYIVKHGVVRILRRDPLSGQEKEVAALQDGDFFGEMGLVLTAARNATALAVSECEVFELKKEDFAKLMETSPKLANMISSEFLARTKKNERG